MRRARHESKKLQLQLRQLETTLESQRQEFAISIAKQRSSQEFLLETYQIKREAATAKAAIYASSQTKYRQARASIRDLLDAEIQNLSAELELLRTENGLIRQMLDYSYETRDGDILKGE